MRADLPTGTVTFLFTDIEGSTRLLHELGDGYAPVLAEHHRVLRQVWVRHSGVAVDTAGDAFFVAFAQASDAVAAAVAAQALLADGPLQVRMGLHTGEPLLAETGYVGRDVHLAARIGAVAHGGQVVVSRRTRDLAEVELTDLREHRVKDFDEPVWLFQVGPRVFPPLRTIANTNLPRPVSSFVGRAREVGEVAALLRAGARLVTLSGTGGTGKTRLALEAASELVPEYANGVFWVPLATLRDPGLVPAAIAQSVGAKGALQAHFSGKRVLLLLDNLEQVVEAAVELAALLEACPGLALLVTSRELMRVRGEVQYPVSPLAEPDAVELFCVRSRLPAGPDVTELCRRLDQLPLAVELAAARTNVLSPVQILARLADRLDLLKGGRGAEARHATLRATIQWSHDLLPADEQRLFARLSVFVGGCTLDAAQTVCDAGLDTLASVADKSLVRHTAERYWMLETIREYALERLDALRATAAARDAHARFFLEIAEQAAPQLRGQRQSELLDQLEAERANVRSALGWLHEGAAEDEARLAGACWYFWYARSHLREGRDALRAAFERADELSPASLVKLHDGLTTLESLLGEPDRARVHAAESLRLYRELDDPQGLLRGLLNQSFAGRSGDYGSGRIALDELIELARELDDRWYLAVGLGNRGSIALDEGELELAHRLYVEALAVAEETGDDQLVTAWVTVVAQVRLELGLIGQAAAGFAAGIEQAARLSLHEPLLWGIEGAAALAARTGRPERAAWLFGAVDTMAAELDYPLPPFFVARRRALTGKMRERLSVTALDSAGQKGAAALLQDAVGASLEVCAE